MKVYIKNKFMSLGGSSTVVDENKQPIYKVKGKIISITKKKKIKDMSGKTLFTVRNKWLNFFTHKAFIYDENKKKIATVKDKWINVKQEYFIEGLGDEIKIEGGFFSLTCEILKNGAVIGIIRRKIDFLVDSFELEADEKDIPFLIALVIAIDNIVDNRHRQ